jgi:hypothetical protein
LPALSSKQPPTGADDPQLDTSGAVPDPQELPMIFTLHGHMGMLLAWTHAA